MLEDLLDVLEWKSFPPRIVSGVPIQVSPIPALYDWLGPPEQTDDDIHDAFAPFMGF